MRSVDERSRPPRRVVVVGAGVSGLAFAYEALRVAPDLEVTVLEAAPRVGGLVQTLEPSSGLRVELGPDAMASASPASGALLAAIGLSDARATPGAAPRRAFVGRDGRLAPLPPSLLGDSPSAYALVTSGLFRTSTVLRMAFEPLVGRGPVGGESADHFLARRFGRGFVDDAMGPLLAAIYHAPLEALGADEVLGRFVALERSYGSVARGLRLAKGNAPPALFSLPDGMEQLPRAIARNMVSRIRLGVTVDRVTATARGKCVRATDGSTLEADLVVVTAPPAPAARILGDIAPDAANELAAVPSAKVETISFVYATADAPPHLDGTGIVLGEGAARVLRAVTWSSRKWRGRAPEGLELLRCSVQGGDLDDESLLRALRCDVDDWLGCTREPAAVFVDRGRVALPIHRVGHAASISAARRSLDREGGIAILGNGVDALGVGDCLARAVEAARRTWSWT